MFNPINFKGKKALVIGAGRSGTACANLLAAKGFKVLLTEEKKAEAVKEKLKSLSRSVKVETGGHGKAVFNSGFAVKSPGMSHFSPLIAALKKKKIPIFSEIEIALAFSKAGKLLAVTGTNGKTTTTALLGKIMSAALSASGGRALVCGNVGIPAAEAVPKARPRDAVVMEVSSYQLEDSVRLKPDAACVLNITPDHLRQHGSMAAYVKAKEKVFKFQYPSDCCVFNYEDAYCRRLAKTCPSKVFFFSSKRSGGKLAAWTAAGKLFFKTGESAISVKPPALPGAHNLENAMCAGLMALHCGVKPAVLKKVFTAFR
ncbi:MAG: UDP-N-acetylmuramoyl-L-alanine--D-glutamate ligase, partial [Elusimicrobiota bacterium]